MEPSEALVLAAGALFALGVGANTSGSALAAAYGSGAVGLRRGLLVVAAFALMGGLVAGGRVAGTVSSGIVPRELLTPAFAAGILLAAAATVLLSNYHRVPVSTTHVLVGAVAGLGVYFGRVNIERVGLIIIVWLVTVPLALALGYIAARWAYPPVVCRITCIASGRAGKAVVPLLLLSGGYVAFSMGANSTALVAGLIAGSGVAGPLAGAALAGGAIATGTLLLGGRPLHTAGKEITALCTVRAVLLNMNTASIVMASALAGVPVSLTLINTAGIVGMGLARDGYTATARNRAVRRIAVAWAASPLAASAGAFGVVALLWGLGG